MRPTSVATVWFENRLEEEPYRHRQRGDTLRIEAEHFTDQRDGTWYKQSRYAGFSGDGYAQEPLTPNPPRRCARRESRNPLSFQERARVR